ncbi:MAG: cytochrome c-type biogenesis CcmF C-terminal domain-containing protein, partial [Acidobacteriota bacterium]
SFTKSAIGPTILAFVAASLIYSIVLLAMRIDSLENEGRIEGAMSRESMFLVNNLIFIVITFTVLIGTVFPLVVEAIRGKQMSVGRPYFESMIVPAGVGLLFLLGLGPALPWGRATREQILKALAPPLFGAAILAVLGFVLGVRNGWTMATLAVGGYAAWVTFAQMWLPVAQRRSRGEPIADAVIQAQWKRGRRRFASYIVHAGAVIVIIAISVSSTMRTQREATLHKGESATIQGYVVQFLGIDVRDEPHRVSTVARFSVTKNGRQVTTLEPRMNQYAAMREPIGTPAVHSTLKGDLYLSLMSIDPASDTAGVLLITTPMVSWIWIAVLLMGLGGLIALIPTKSVYRLAPEKIVIAAEDAVTS